MNKEWFIFKGTHHLGPFSKEEVKEFYQNGEVKDETLIWKEGNEKWLPLSKSDAFKFLFKDEDEDEDELPPIPFTKLPKKVPGTFFNEEHQEENNDDELPPPIPLDAILDPAGLSRNRMKSEAAKSRFSKSFLIVGAVLFSAVMIWFYLNERQASIQLKIKGLMPVYLEKLEMTAINHSPRFEAAIALSLDSQTLWASTNQSGEIATVIRLTSIPKRVLGTENISLTVKGDFINHVGRFNRMVLTEGSRFLPGEYNFHIEARQIHYINRHFKSLSGISFFKALNKSFSYDGTTIIYAGTPREFDKKLDEYQASIAVELLKPLQDKLERVQTFESLLNATSQNFLMELEHVKIGKNISGFEKKFMKEISPLLQSLVVKAQELSYKEQVQLGKQLGEMASDMITHTQKFKKLTPENKNELKAEFDTRSRAIKTQIDINIKLLEDEIQKISKP